MNLSLLTFVMLMEQKHLCIQKILSASGLGKLGSCLQWQSGQSGVKLPQRGAVRSYWLTCLHQILKNLFLLQKEVWLESMCLLEEDSFTAAACLISKPLYSNMKHSCPGLAYFIFTPKATKFNSVYNTERVWATSGWRLRN